MDATVPPRNLIEVIQNLKEKGIPEAEYKIYTYRFLESKARKMCIPLHGSFELTPFCNLDCKMCYVHLEHIKADNKELLPTEAWKVLMRQARKAGMMNATLTGGECLTYPGFDELFCFLKEMGISAAVLTNGVLMNEKRVGFFLRHRPSLIQITLYGSSEDAYEKVTGHRVFHTVYENIIRLRDADLPLHISITPSAFMRDDIRPLLTLVNDLKVSYSINSNLKPARKDTGREAEDLTAEQYIELFTLEGQLGHRELFPGVNFCDLPEENRFAGQRAGLHCGAGRSAFAILYNGDMVPCLSLYESKASPLEAGFEKAWRQINDIAKHYPVPAECGGCAYFGQCLVCPVAHENAPEPGHCDPRICERTRKMVGAGVLALPHEMPGVSK